MDRLIRKTEGSIDEAGHSLADQDKRLTAALEEFRTAVEDADRMFTSGSRLIDETDRRLARMHQQMSSSLRHMESVTSNLNRLIEKLVNQPSQLLFSDPPPPKRLKKEGPRP
jgi:phospholipid/cholesterol/gamma-HCH transport system substrate-binding protein